MKKSINLTILTLLISAFTLQCSKDEDKGKGKEEGSCETLYKAPTASQEDGFDGVELCKVNGKVQHIKIEELNLTKAGQIFTILMGFEKKPDIQSQETDGPALTNEQFYMMFWSAMVPMTSFGIGKKAVSSIDNENARSIKQYRKKSTTICMDLKDTAPVELTVWVDGEKNAKCDDPKTLTAENASLENKDWGSNPKKIATKRNFYGTTGKFKKIVLYNKTKKNK